MYDSHSPFAHKPWTVRVALAVTESSRVEARQVYTPLSSSLAELITRALFGLRPMREFSVKSMGFPSFSQSTVTSRFLLASALHLEVCMTRKSIEVKLWHMKVN